MKGEILAFMAGVAAALGLAAYKTQRFAPRVQAGLGTLDLNTATAEAFAAIGIDTESAERIVENRPYRRKLELLERYVLGQSDYNRIKRFISTDRAHANDAVRVAG